MVERIFDDIKGVREINSIAANLKKIGAAEELGLLAEKNKIPKQDVESFLHGKRYFLVDGGCTNKQYETARSKLMDEMLLLDDQYFGDPIGRHLLKCCNGTVFGSLVLQKHKTLQRCIEYLMSKALELASEGTRERRENVGLAYSDEVVYGWAEEYYALNDSEKVAQDIQKLEETFLKQKEPRKPYDKKKAPKKRNASNPTKGKQNGKSAKEPAKNSSSEEMELMETEKNQIEGQVSLFDSGAFGI